MQTLEQKFIKAYDTHADAIFRYALYRVRNYEQAKDVMHDAYIKTWQYLVDGNTIRNLRAFLYQTTRNLIVDQSRKQTAFSLEEKQEQGFEPTGTKAATIEDQAELQQVFEKIDKLDSKYREALLLRYVEGYPPREIAEILGESPNVISVRINRGMKQLKQLFDI